MNKNNRREQGQVMVLMAIGFVVFLGFVALAIDGGRVFSDRRHAQNASDASSLAGGGAAAMSMENSHVTYGTFNCASGSVATAEAAAVAAAISRAASNTFTIDGDISDVNGAITDCGIDSSHGWLDKYIDVTVQISSTTQTNFAQVLGRRMLRNQVQAITRVRPRSPLAFGNAIVALNEDGCDGNQNGVIFGGNSGAEVEGGGVWSNGCLRDNGGPGVTVTGGGISYVGETVGDFENFDPAPNPMPEPLPPNAYEVPVPDCSDPDAIHIEGNLTHHNGTLDLDPGLYCISGDIVINGGEVFGDGVTFYLESGNVTINGNADPLSLNSPSTSPDPSPAVPGLLFYVASGDVSLEGNNTSQYTGLIYAPQGTVTAAGANNTLPTFNTQIIGMNVFVTGGATVDIRFNEGQEYSRPTLIELHR